MARPYPWKAGKNILRIPPRGMRAALRVALIFEVVESGLASGWRRMRGSFTTLSRDTAGHDTPGLSLATRPAIPRSGMAQRGEVGSHRGIGKRAGRNAATHRGRRSIRRSGGRRGSRPEGSDASERLRLQHAGAIRVPAPLRRECPHDGSTILSPQHWRFAFTSRMRDVRLGSQG